MKTRFLPAILIAATGSAFATPIVDIDFATWADANADNNLDDGERIQDISGNGYHGFWGATTGNIPVVATSAGFAIDTSGSANGKVFLRDGLNAIPDAWDGPTTTATPYFTFDGTQSYTFEAVVNWNHTVQTINGLMGQAGGNELWLRESGGKLHYAFVSGAANANLFTSDIDLSAAKADGNWHAIAVVYDASAKQIRTYLDGSLLHTNSDSDIGALGPMGSGTADFFVGAYNGAASNYFDGQQGRYRISTSALAPASLLVAPAVVVIPSKDITWTGNTNGNWDATTPDNWKLDSNGSPALYQDNDRVTFSDSAIPFAGPVTIVGTLQPKNIVVDAETIPYIFTGGSVTGAAALTKSKAATLTLAASFNNSGSIAVNGGALVVGDGATHGSIGSGPVTLASGTSLKVFRNDTVDYSGDSNLKSISGPGSFTLDGGATLKVNPGAGTGFGETNSWSTLSGGVTVIGNSELQTLRNGRTAMGSGIVTLGNATTSGALAQYNGSWTWTNDISLAGPANAIRNRSSGSFARVLKLQGIISGSGGLAFEDPNGTMTDNQTGFILTGGNTLDGTLTIASGVPLRVGGVPGDTNVAEIGPGAAGSLGSATVIDDGFLTFSRTDSHQVANDISGAGELFVGLTTGTEMQVVNLTGNVSIAGNTTIRSGTLLLNGVHGSAAAVNSIMVGAGATLGGAGATTSDIHLSGNLAPGNAVGNLTSTGWLFLNGGSSYTWEPGAWSGGAAGTDSDLVTADEIHIDASALPANPITIKIAPGHVTGFAETPQTFVIARATSAVLDFNPDAFVIDAGDFNAATGTWAVQQNGASIELVYTPGSGLTGYARWISGFNVGGRTALNDDFDKDNMPNGIEFLLGGNPSIANDVSLPALTAGGSDLVLTFERDDQAIGAVTATVQTSSDLATWLPQGEIVIGKTSSAGVSVTDRGATDTVAVTIPKAGASQKFARLKVENP